MLKFTVLKVLLIQTHFFGFNFFFFSVKVVYSGKETS